MIRRWTLIVLIPLVLAACGSGTPTPTAGLGLVTVPGLQPGTSFGRPQQWRPGHDRRGLCRGALAW